MKNSSLMAESKCKQIAQEKEELKQKLDRLWSRTEEEKEIAMVVTKQEVERNKMTEIEELKDRLFKSEQDNNLLKERHRDFQNLEQ